MESLIILLILFLEDMESIIILQIIFLRIWKARMIDMIHYPLKNKRSFMNGIFYDSFEFNNRRRFVV